VSVPHPYPPLIGIFCNYESISNSAAVETKPCKECSGQSMRKISIELNCQNEFSSSNVCFSSLEIYQFISQNEVWIFCSQMTQKFFWWPKKEICFFFHHYNYNTRLCVNKLFLSAYLSFSSHVCVCVFIDVCEHVYYIDIVCVSVCVCVWKRRERERESACVRRLVSMLIVTIASLSTRTHTHSNTLPHAHNDSDI